MGERRRETLGGRQETGDRRWEIGVRRRTQERENEKQKTGEGSKMYDEQCCVAGAGFFVKFRLWLRLHLR